MRPFIGWVLGQALYLENCGHGAPSPSGPGAVRPGDGGTLCVQISDISGPDRGGVTSPSTPAM
jgi:hypothetical protein